MASTVEQIKNKLGIIEVVGSYLKLEKAGINFKSRCPFHNEKTPSFFVSPSRDSYYCFGCGKNGDIFSFVQEFEGVDFIGSLKILADRAGVVIEKIDPKLKNQNDKLLTLLEETTLFYEENLEKNPRALKYLKERGLEKKILKSFRIGFAQNEWRSLLEYLTKKGYSEKEIDEAGLIKESQGKVYDRFRSRIMFPVSDPSGRTVAFSGRIFGEENDEIAKYLNSPETKFFKKSNTLFGYDKAKIDIRKNNFAILVEGNVDVLMAHQAGYRNTVAPLGTALTREQLDKVSRLTKRIVIAFDSDGAGFKASSRGAKIALSVGIDLKIASIPEGYDPADLIIKDKDEWKDVIKNSTHIIEFYLSRLKNDEKDERKLGLKIKEEILPFVAMLENKIDQAHFVKILSETMGISEEKLYEEVEKIEIKDLDVSYPEDKKSENTDIDSRRKMIIRRIIGILLWQESMKKPTVDTKFIRKEIQKITGKETILDDFSSNEKSDLIFEADILYEGSLNVKVELKELFGRLEEDYLKERLNLKMKELKKAENEGDSKTSMKALKECQNLSKQIAKIKSEF
jgi:DNA primase